MPCNCSKKKMTTSSEKSVVCDSLAKYNVNSFSSKNANENLSLIGRTLCAFREAISNFVEGVQVLNNELLYGNKNLASTVSASLKKYTVLQRSMLTEMKTLADTHLVGTNTNIVGVSLSNNVNPSDLSSNLNDAQTYFYDANGTNIVKICPSKTYNVNFKDGSSIPVVNVPSFSFNFDQDNDNISVRVGYKDDYVAQNSEQIAYFTITPDTQDGYLYKNENGVYEGDLMDTHFPSELVNKSMNNLMEYYESIINYKEGYPGLLSSDQTNSTTGNDIDAFMRFLDLAVFKVNAAMTTVNLKCRVMKV